MTSVPGGSERLPAAKTQGASSNAHTPSASKIKFRFMIKQRAPAGLRSPLQKCKPSPNTAAKHFASLTPLLWHRHSCLCSCQLFCTGRLLRRASFARRERFYGAGAFLLVLFYLCIP